MTVVEKFWPKIDSNGIANNRIGLFIEMNSSQRGKEFGSYGKVVKFYSYWGVAANLKTFLADKNPFSPTFVWLIDKVAERSSGD